MSRVNWSAVLTPEESLVALRGYEGYEEV